jgi:hypothetical protein
MLLGALAKEVQIDTAELQLACYGDTQTLQIAEAELERFGGLPASRSCIDFIMWLFIVYDWVMDVPALAHLATAAMRPLYAWGIVRWA